MAFYGSGSYTVLRIYFNDGNKRTFYSPIRVDKRYGQRSGINVMVKRLLQTNFAGKYATAIFYDVASGKEIERWLKGIKQ